MLIPRVSLRFTLGFDRIGLSARSGMTNAYMWLLGFQPALDGVSRVCHVACPVCRDVACYVSIIPSVGNRETLHATSLRGVLGLMGCVYI